MRLVTRLVACLPLAALVLAGCSNVNPDAPAKITGVVKYKGAPVSGGNIAFHYKDGKPTANASIGSDGSYNTGECSSGDATVTIETESINPEKKQKTYTQGGRSAPMSPKPESAQAAKTVYVKIPEKYSDKTKSGLTYTVVNGEQKKDFDLSD